MNVIYVTHYPDLYGANRSLLDLIDELIIQKSNLRVKVLLNQEGDLVKELIKRRIDYEIIAFKNWFVDSTARFPRRQILFIKGIIKLFYNILLAFYVSNRFKRLNIDIIHTNSIATNFGAFFSFWLKKRHIWHIREFGEEDYSLTFDVGNRISYCIIQNLSSKIICISNAVKQKYSNRLKTNKIETIYNGIQVKSIPKREIGFDASKNLILIGALYPKKGQDKAIMAVKLLIEKGYTDLKLHIVGDSKDSDYKNLLNQIVSKFNLENNIIFHGYIPYPGDILKECHVGLACSEQEAFGRIAVEYMLTGLPVIYNNSGGLKEIVEDVGLFYNSEFDELAERIEILITDKKKYDDLSFKAYERAIDFFSIKKTAQGILNIYKLN